MLFSMAILLSQSYVTVRPAGQNISLKDITITSTLNLNFSFSSEINLLNLSKQPKGSYKLFSYTKVDC